MPSGSAKNAKRPQGNSCTSLASTPRSHQLRLNAIENASGLTAGELAVEVGLTSGAVTGVVDRLERAGFARRVPDPADRRRVKVEVTPGVVTGLTACICPEITQRCSRRCQGTPSNLLLLVAPGVSVPTGLPPCPGLRGEPCRDYQVFANRPATP